MVRGIDPSGSEVGARTDVRVGLVIPTLNAGERWPLCLERVVCQSLRPHRLVIVDSASDDGTTESARLLGFEILSIARAQFNHGGTRQWAAEYLHDCDLVVFLTQDAILADADAIAEIVRCFDDPQVALAYGRQLPHAWATPIEAHAREFNYAAQSLKKDAAAADRIGAKVFFCSNSFAAYRRSVLLGLEGFRRDLILGEDMEFAARAIAAGYANYYCASALVHHSHDYTAVQTFRRYFDLGVFDRRHAWMRARFGSHSGEGLRFIRSELRFLAARAPAQIPRSVLRSVAKLVGYRCGRAERWLPRPLKRVLTMQPSFWR